MKHISTTLVSIDRSENEAARIALYASLLEWDESRDGPATKERVLAALHEARLRAVQPWMEPRPFYGHRAAMKRRTANRSNAPQRKDERIP